MNPGIRHKIRLELIQIDVQRAVEAQTTRNTAHDLRNQTVQVFKRRARDIEVAATDVVHGLVVDEERAVAVLDGAVG